MKHLALGLSFICFYFLLPQGAQAASLAASQDRATASVLSKPASCMVIRSAECSKRIMVGDGWGAGASFFLAPTAVTFEVQSVEIPASLNLAIAFADRKHVNRTGLSPPGLV